MFDKDFWTKINIGSTKLWACSTLEVAPRPRRARREVLRWRAMFFGAAEPLSTMLVENHVTHVGLTLQVPDHETLQSFPVDRTHFAERCDAGCAARAACIAQLPPRCAAQPPRGAERLARFVPFHGPSGASALGFDGPGRRFVTAKATGSCPETDAAERANSGTFRRCAPSDGAPGWFHVGAFFAAGIHRHASEERRDRSVIGSVPSCGPVESPGLRKQFQGRGIGACGAGEPVRLELHRQKTRRNLRRCPVCRHAGTKMAGQGIRP